MRRTRCFPVKIKWSLDKCNAVCDSDTLVVASCVALHSLLLSQHLSADFYSRLNPWPAWVYTVLFIPGIVPRWLWKVFNELSCKEKVVLAHQHSFLLPVSASLSYLQPYLSCFLLSWVVFPELKSPRRVNSPSVERYIICWDLHVTEECKEHKMHATL